MDKRKTYCSIDIMKFMGAVLVVAIHTTPLKEYNQYLSFGITQIIARIAVPFFFVCAGYFFTMKLSSCDNSKVILKNYLKRLLVLYLCWSAIYFIYDIKNQFLYTDNILIVIIKYIRDFVFLGSHFHLWYVPALMLGIILLYMALISEKIKLYFSISVLLYFIGLIGDSYFGVIKEHTVLMEIFNLYFRLFVTTRNGIFFAFIFIMLGAMIFLEKRKISKKWSLTLSIITFILLVVEANVLEMFSIPKDHNLYIMLVPFCYYFFKHLITSDIRINEELSYELRVYSMGIYFIHGIFLIFYSNLYAYLGVSNINTINFTLVLISSLLSIWIIRRLRIPILNNLIR